MDTQTFLSLSNPELCKVLELSAILCLHRILKLLLDIDLDGELHQLPAEEYLLRCVLDAVGEDVIDAVILSEILLGLGIDIFLIPFTTLESQVLAFQHKSGDGVLLHVLGPPRFIVHVPSQEV